MRSTSAGSNTAALIGFTENGDAAATTGRRNRSANGALCGLKTSATRVTRGAVCLSASSHLVPIENSKLVKPVRLPPGCAMFGTKPWPTGSVTCVNTIGTAPLCSHIAAVTGVLLAKIRSGPMASSSAAWSRNTLPSPAQRYSIERLRPLTHPGFRRPFSNAATRDCASGSLATSPISTPMRRICSDCCARAATGHATAPPPSSVMNSRRLTSDIGFLPPWRRRSFYLTPNLLETHATQLRCNPNLGIRKDGRERSAAAVRKRIRPVLAIVREQSPDGPGLHRMVDDADRAVVNAGRDAEQNHAVLCAEFCRRLFHRLDSPPALGEGGHRSLIASERPSNGSGHFVVGGQLFQQGQVGEIFRMGLLHLSHERGAELIRHVKARRPFQRVDQYLIFRRLERPHHCRRQARIVADMTDRLLAHCHVGVGNPLGEYLHRFVTVIAGVMRSAGKPGSEIAYHVGLALDGRPMRGRHHHIGHVVAAAYDQKRVGNLLEHCGDIGLPRHHRIDLALLQGRRQSELRPDVLNGKVFVFHTSAAQHHLKVFVGCLPAREPD